MSKLVNLLFGRPLASSEQAAEKMGVWTGIPALGLDGLSSAAYGPEAALTILLPLGAAGLYYIGPIILVILALLAVLYLSYRQTIAAYPDGGGSYTVAKENLGTRAGLLAAAALMLDYVLNVAVGVSAGIGALISAVPALHPYTLPLCLVVLLGIAMINLRGTGEAGLAFALPTFLFVGCLGAVLIIGIIKALAAGGHPAPVSTPPALPGTLATVSLWLLMRSFASGCTAMTGVEAVSNGVNAFREPAVRNARHTLTAIVIILAALLGGIAYLSRAYTIGAMDEAQPAYQTVLAQLTAAVVGQGTFYYITMGSILCVLALSANTSFVDFPRLCRLLAHDDFLPRPFTNVGRRLVYSVGIAFLTVTSALLLIGFGGVTDNLIPLFAVGAFLAFTLSQMGMVKHHRRTLMQLAPSGAEKEVRKTRVRLAVNAIGATATGAALAVILVAKFWEGAWITVLAVPILLLLFKIVKHHYEHLTQLLQGPVPLDLRHNHPPVVVLPTHNWNHLTGRALRFGMRLSPDVIALHLCDLEGLHCDDQTDELRQQWSKDVELPAEQAGIRPPRLHIIHSEYRRFLEPIVHFVRRIEEEHPGRQVAVIIPEVVQTSLWHWILHNRRATRLREALLRKGGTRIVVISVPWHLHDLVEKLDLDLRQAHLVDVARHDSLAPDTPVAANASGAATE